MRVETRHEMPQRIKAVGPGYARQSIVAMKEFFRRQHWLARFVIVISISAIAFLLAVFLFTYGSRIYEESRQSRLLNRATTLLQEGKLSKAAQTAKELLTRHPNSLPALYLLAEAAEKQNLPEAVEWREQITRLSPGDLDSQLNLASAALRFGKLDLARQALNRIPVNDRDKAAFHVVSGWLARAEGNFTEQEQQFAAAVKKEPNNELYQFNLAALQIHSGDPEKNAHARDTLQQLSKVARYRTGALRALLNDAVARNDLSAADNFAQQLQMSPEVTFGDYLLCLNFYRKLDEKKFRLSLERVKTLAARDSSNVASLMDWMNQHGLATEVVKWIDSLPAAQLSSTPTSLAVADAYASVKNWSRLKRWTRAGDWGGSEYLRLAYQAIATRQSRSRSGTPGSDFETLWRPAEQLAGEKPERELALARLASKSQLKKQSEELWWRVSENPQNRREALEALRRIYRANNEIEKLYDVLQRLHDSSPNDPPITGDLARLGLDVGENIERSHDLAKEAYDRAPDEINCAVTYAFSLWWLGKTADAVAILHGLAPEGLHDPHAAVYVALLLAEAGDIQAANEYIAAAEDGEIYPEEEKLLERAKSKLAAASPTPSATVSPFGGEAIAVPTASPR